MIKITAFNNKELYLNPDLFEKIELTPDTVITLTNGKIYVVKDKPEDIINRIIEYRKKYSLYTPEIRNKD